MTYQDTLRKIDEALQEAGDYLKIENEPFMALSIDRTGYGRFAIAHNFIQNGDVMADPDMEIQLRPEGYVALHFQQDSTGTFWPSFNNDGTPTRYMKDNQDFLKKWCANLVRQGFIKKLSEKKGN
jgi:hypothetical protein